MKTVFGEAHFSVPRQKCPDCQQTFSVSTPLLEATHPLDDSNVTQALRKIAILCGSSWTFRQAANVLRELTGVKLSFGHIRWLCADEAKVATSLQSFYLYLNNNFDSIIDYHRYRRNGYFISSVFVEKTIDLLICRRLKLRGQNWSRKGADNIVTFRQMIQNDDWKDYWQRHQAA